MKKNKKNKTVEYLLHLLSEKKYNSAIEYMSSNDVIINDEKKLHIAKFNHDGEFIIYYYSDLTTGVFSEQKILSYSQCIINVKILLEDSKISINVSLKNKLDLL